MSNKKNEQEKKTDAVSQVGSFATITKEDLELSENFRVISPSRMVLKRFFRSKLSIVGLVMLAFVFIFSFVGPVIVDIAWANLGYFDEATLPAESYVFTYVYKEGEEIETMVSSKEFVAADGKKYTYYDESLNPQIFKRPPSAEHWLGTDSMGMDVFVRLMYGGRISLTLSFLVVIIETIIGVIMGGLAGYYGGWVDQLIMRVVDILNCLPGLPILLILSSVIASIKTISPEHRIYYVMGVLCIISWSGVARLVRGQILMLREQEYIMAAEATGLPSWRKIVKHLLPNVMPQLIVSLTLGLGGIILYESTLSYLGLGVPFPRAAWGSMIAQADPSKGQEILAYYPNMWVPAGILIVVTVLGFNFVGDGLRDAFDPRMKR